MIPFDKRKLDDETFEFWAFAVVFSIEESTTPCKLVKLNFKRLNESSTPTYAIKETFKSASLIEDDKTVIFTSESIVVYNVDCNAINQL